MRHDLTQYVKVQVFLNYPFDEAFRPFELALHFSVAAAGLIPVCAKDLTTPDRSRLEALVDAITKCRYSVHDFSRFTGAGERNLARFNVPLEMGMALFHALQTQRQEHRCAFLVPTQHDYTAFASDLAGLDPKCHYNNEMTLISSVYEWLRGVVPTAYFNSVPTGTVIKKYSLFKDQLPLLERTAVDGQPSFFEIKELMYRICSACQWWDFRNWRGGISEFPLIPLSWRDAASQQAFQDLISRLKLSAS